MQYFPDSIFSLFYPFTFSFLNLLCSFTLCSQTYVNICGKCECVPQYTCEGYMAACRSWFSPSIMWDPRDGTQGLQLWQPIPLCTGAQMTPPPIQAVSVQAILEFIIFPYYGIISSFWLLSRWFGNGTKWCCPPGNGFWLEYYALELLGTAGTVCSMWQGEQSRGKTLLSMVGLVHLYPFALVHWRYCHLTRKKINSGEEDRDVSVLLIDQDLIREAIM